MTVWFHPLTIFGRRYSLRIAAILALCVALTTTLLFGIISQSINAAPGTNKTLSFQGRLLDASGNSVTDGTYNIQFKIYQDGTGTTAGNSGGTLKWTETYINNGGSSGVEVKNGYLSVNLGSNNPFGTSVDWNQDTLWLSMNIAGSATSCTTFGTSPCVADGEMLPMKRMSASPYAINSAQLEGKTASNFIQLAQGVQEDATTNTSLFVNKTSTGNLIQLQNTATDIFTVDNSGDITLGNNENKTISITTSGAATNGRSLTVSAGGGGSGSGSSGGTLVLQGGDAGGTNGNGGTIAIDAGAKTGTGTGGSISIGETNAAVINIGSVAQAVTQDVTVGANNTAGSTTNVTVGAGASATGGTTAIQSKDSTTVSTNGTQRARFSSTSNTLYVGNANDSGNATTANGFTIQGTSSTASNTQGGSLTVQAGSATSGNANGGNLILSGGVGVGTGAEGLVVIETPAFQTASQQNFSANGAVTQANIDGTGVLVLNASNPALTITLNDPTITTPGRIVYVTAASGSSTFTLAVNGGGSGNDVTMRQNTTSTLLWNGVDWTVAGAGNSATLQDIFNNTLQANAGNANLSLANGAASSTLTIRDDSTTPVDGALLAVEASDSSNLFSVNNPTSGVSNVKIGNSTGEPTLLTVDTASTAPTISDSALIGSMYYDTTLGGLQCYEATGWGSCSASPDNFITLSPEYSNAVIHTTDTGTMTTGICSDSLNINDGSSSQPTICGSNETYNFYNWTSASGTTHNRSIYVTYQLPTSFKQFVSGSTSLMGRTDSSDAAVSFQVYKNTTAGLTACGSSVSVSSGSQSTWQKGTATSTADPATCTFTAGDSIVFKVSMASANDANAYASTLNFAYTTK